MPLFALSAWAQPATVLAGSTGEGAALVSVRSLVVVSDSHCGCGRDKVRTLLWPLFAWSA
jgi:hypothetical protein